MVFLSSPDPQPLLHSLSHSLMASSSYPKPHKPLHNFPLQDLRWSVNQTNHRSRKPADSPHKLLHFVSDGSPVGNNAKAGSTRRSSPDRKSDNPDKKMRVSDFPIFPAENSVKKAKTKICIRLKTKPIKPAGEPSEQVKHAEVPTKQIMPAGEFIEVPTKLMKHAEELANTVNERQDRDQLMELDDSIAKTWNLRPRRKLTKRHRRNGGVKRLSVAVNGEAKDPSLPESSRPIATDDAMVTQRKDKEMKDKPNKTHFSIPLTKLEIEEDMYALTGSKPSRKPLKRAKHLQKQLDNLFPGMWLSSVTPETYKVHESRAKIP